MSRLPSGRRRSGPFRYAIGMPRESSMTADKNRQILLAARPHGEPTAEDFRLVEAEVPKPGPGQMLLRTIYLSLDPYMRGRMNAGPSYAPPVEVGAVMEGGTVCEVVKSSLPEHQVGDVVVG